MRRVLTATAVLAVCGVIAFSTARAAEPTHDLGGPVQASGMCWTATDGQFGIYGYWTKCPDAAKPAAIKKKKV